MINQNDSVRQEDSRLKRPVSDQGAAGETAQSPTVSVEPHPELSDQEQPVTAQSSQESLSSNQGLDTAAPAEGKEKPQGAAGALADVIHTSWQEDEGSKLIIDSINNLDRHLKWYIWINLVGNILILIVGILIAGSGLYNIIFVNLLAGNNVWLSTLACLIGLLIISFSFRPSRFIEITNSLQQASRVEVTLQGYNHQLKLLENAASVISKKELSDYLVQIQGLVGDTLEKLENPLDFDE